MPLQALFPDLVLPESARELPISGIALDSRELKKGFVFFAQQGQAQNGEAFIDQAIHAGALVVVKQAAGQQSDFAWHAKGTFILTCAELKKSLGGAADIFYGQSSKKMTLVGITGTNGKTSCADLFTQCWRKLGETPAASIGTLGWSVNDGEYHPTGMTTPDVISNHKRLHDLFVSGVRNVAMEVSSHGIDQARISHIEFDVAVLTNISRDHLDYHKSMEAYAAIKTAFLASVSGIKVLNIDSDYVRDFSKELSQNLLQAESTITYSLSRSEADVYVSDIKYALEGLEAELHSPWGSQKIVCPLMGDFNLSNALALVCGLCKLGHSLSAVLKAIALLQPIRGRMERVVGLESNAESYFPVAQNIFIDYAHTPDALETALKALKKHVDGNLILVFGCGGDRDQGKRALMGEIAARLADKVFITSDNSRSESTESIMSDILKGTYSDEHVYLQADRSKAIAQALASLNKVDALLIAGKGHEEYQDIAGCKVPFNDLHEVRRHIAALNV